MGDLIVGDDGLAAEEVGLWAKEKHDLLCRYVDICRSARAKYLGPGKGGATYIDLFCGTGRARVRETGEFIHGSPVAAWERSRSSGSPFSKVIIGDADPIRLDAATQRLTILGANVVPLVGTARDTAFQAIQRAGGSGLHFAFLDPYNLETLHFEIFRTLSRLRRIDILVHVSTMDMQRNLDVYMTQDPSPLDSFAPGWREGIGLDRAKGRARGDIFEFWRELIAGAGVETSKDVRSIKGSRGQRLYWLLLAARHELAQNFWKAALRSDGQGTLDI